ncbi:MAG: DUF1800 domain-containing protein [Caldilineaceae bacterium]
MPDIQSDRMASPSNAPHIAPHSQTTQLTACVTDRSPHPIAGAADAELRATRRNVLLAGGAAALAAVGAAAAPRTKALKAQSTPSDQPHMRSAQRITAATTNAPTLPPLAVIALNRMGFGPRPGDIAAFNALGATPEARLAAYVEQQLNPAAIDDSACDAIIAAQGYVTLNKSLAQLWADHVKKEGITYSERLLPATESRNATLLRAIYSKRQLTEVLADHWFNHFNIYGWDSWTAPVFVHYDRDVIRANMLGNFRTLLQAVAQSPAMLYYLDNQSNTGGNPNENYARELFELHALGAENYMGVVPLILNDGAYEHPAPKDENGKPLLYVDADVYGATTCFTGWAVNGDTGLFHYDANAHFPYQKVVLGRLIPDSQGIKDGQDVLDILARHVGTAHYICRKLCRRLISDDPPERIVQAAADVFMANLDAPDQLKKVTRTILLSAEFQSTWGAKIKRPFEYTISILRAAEGDFTPENSFFWSYDAMGQSLFSWQPPNGYPDVKESWSSTMPMLQRWRMCNYLIDWKYGGDGANKDDKRLPLLNPASVKSPNAIITYWSDRLLGIQLPDGERGPIVDFLANGRNPNSDLPEDQIAERLRYAIALIFMAPSFQWR